MRFPTLQWLLPSSPFQTRYVHSQFSFSRLFSDYRAIEPFDSPACRLHLADGEDARNLNLLEITKRGLWRDVFLCNTLITSYEKAGDVSSACKVFDEMPKRSDVTWACLISGFARNRLSVEACYLLKRMISDGMQPNTYAIGSALKACKELSLEGIRFGMQIHAYTVKLPQKNDAGLGNVLVSMYGGFAGFNMSANRAFQEIEAKNAVSWNSIISVYSKRGEAKAVFVLFSAMEHECSRANEHTYGSLITAASSFKLSLLLQILTRVAKLGFLEDLYIGSALVSGFSQFEGNEYFWDIMTLMPLKSSVSMNGLMIGLVRQKRAEDAAKVFFQMTNSVETNPDSFVILLTAIAEFSSEIERRRIGQEIHNRVIRTGLIDLKVEIQNALINVYSKCYAIDLAKSVFDQIKTKDTVSWSSIISSLHQNSLHVEAISMYREMRTQGFLPSSYSFISSLASCASLNWIITGQNLHSEAIKLQNDSNVSVSNSLISFYSEAGFLSYCEKLFISMASRDNVTWNAMIGAYSGSEINSKAAEFFIYMMREGWKPGNVTLINTLSGVSRHFSGLGLTKQVHGFVIKHDMHGDTEVANSLIVCYGKNGDMSGCEKIFEKMRDRRDEVSWSSMISGYVHNGSLQAAMELIWFMMRTGQPPNGFTFATILSACASVATLERGMEVHACAVRNRLTADVVVGSAIVDMYAKCGRVDYASRVFGLMPVKNLYSWNSMISGYARHGCVSNALTLFKEMTRHRAPDGVTFVGVLSACSHGGLVEEGFKHFTSMSDTYGLTRSIQHYSCMVDLLGRAGEIRRMEEFVKEMPMEPTMSTWRTILGACSRWRVGRSDLGRKAADTLVRMEPENASNHVLLSNMYASGGKWDEMVRVREAMGGVRKESGCSWVTMKDGIHVFVSGDQSHAERSVIYEKLREINERIKMEGYVPLREYALYDMEDENKDEFLMYHSEKLAVAFALTRSSTMPIRIMKNLRVCGDCHSAFKHISRVFGRFIVLRDTHRFHHFQNGNCSCADFW